MRLTAFLLALIFAFNAHADWREKVDSSLGGMYYAITGKSCQEADYDEYAYSVCKLHYQHQDYQKFGQLSGPGNENFFQALIDDVVYNAAANNVYEMNKCQAEFFDLYQTNPAEKADLDSRAYEQFKIVQSKIRTEDRSVTESSHSLVGEINSAPCANSSDCAVYAVDAIDRHDKEVSPHLKKLQDLVASIPLGNRPEMRQFLLASSEKKPSEAEFKTGYAQVINQLTREAKDSFAHIHAQSYDDPDGKGRLYCIRKDNPASCPRPTTLHDPAAALRRSLLENGMIQNILIQHKMESAMQDGLLCRQARTAAGGYVRIGLEAAATIAVPYAGAAMALRAGLVAARTGSALIKGTAMATRAFMPAVLFGSGFSEGLINARDIYDSCAPPEYLASKSFDSCDAEKQMYEVKAEASIAACVLNATLGVGLPVVGVKLAVRGAKKIEAEAEHTVEAVEEATIVVTGRRPSNRAKDALPPSEDRVVKEYGTRKITSTNENQNYAALARVQEKRPGLVFVDSQNGLLKWLNDNVKSKPLIDAFSNRHSQLINIALETYTRRNPGFRLNVYSDYKGIRYGVQGPVGKETKLAEDLKKIIDDVDARFMRELKDGDYPSFNGKAVDEPWFSTGIARTADEANVQARFPPGTSWEKIDETFKSTESIRETLQRRFGDTTLMRAISGNPSKKVLQTEVFEILRKNSDDALAAKILNHRNGTHLRPEDIALLRQYKDEVNLFAPGLLINDRVLHEFKDAVHGGITVDFAGVGAKNIEATAEGLAMGGSLQTAVAATRRMEMRVTTGLDALKANSERAVNAVLAKHGLKGRVTVSGDDMVVIPDGELSPQVRQELVQALAKADQSPADMRVSFFGRGIRRTDDRATIAAEGEGIEKLLRARLEFLFSRAELNGLTIATDMQGATRGTGDVILQTNGGLNPDQQRIIAREFREAVKDNNKKYQTNFSVAE